MNFVQITKFPHKLFQLKNSVGTFEISYRKFNHREYACTLNIIKY